MGLFDDFTEEDKKRVVTIELTGARSNLYAILLQIGINPETFNEDDWDEPASEDGSPRGRVKYFIDLIASLEAKKAVIDSQL